MQVKIGGTFSPMLEKCSCRYTVNNVPHRKRKWKWENLAFAWADFFRWEEGHNSWREWGDCWRWDWEGKGGASYVALLNYQANCGPQEECWSSKGDCYRLSSVLHLLSSFLPRKTALTPCPLVFFAQSVARTVSEFIVFHFRVRTTWPEEDFATLFNTLRSHLISQNSLFGLPLPFSVCLSLKNVKCNLVKFGRWSNQHFVVAFLIQTTMNRSLCSSLPADHQRAAFTLLLVSASLIYEVWSTLFVILILFSTDDQLLDEARMKWVSFTCSVNLSKKQKWNAKEWYAEKK